MAFSGICLVEYHERKLRREEGPKNNLVNIQESPHTSSGMMHPNEEEVSQKCQEAMDEQGDHGQT